MMLEDRETVSPGLYVDSWWGHYTTSQALLIAFELGWSGADPEDRATVKALALTDQASGRLGVSLEDANEARERAGLPILEDASDVGLDVAEYLDSALEDAEAWLSEHRAPSGHYFGSHPDAGGWGCWAFEEDEELDY